MADNPTYLELETPEGVQSLPLSLISFVEDAGGRRVIHASGTEYGDSRSLHSIKELLGDDFLLTDLRHLVNLSRVRRPVDGAFLMDDGRLVPVAGFLEADSRLRFCRRAAHAAWQIEG